MRDECRSSVDYNPKHRPAIAAGPNQVAAGSRRTLVRNVSTGSLGEALVFNIAIVKGIAA